MTWCEEEKPWPWWKRLWRRLFPIKVEFKTMRTERMHIRVTENGRDIPVVAPPYPRPYDTPLQAILEEDSITQRCIGSDYAGLTFACQVEPKPKPFPWPWRKDKKEKPS